MPYIEAKQSSVTVWKICDDRQQKSWYNDHAAEDFRVAELHINFNVSFCGKRNSHSSNQVPAIYLPQSLEMMIGSAIITQEPKQNFW